MKALYNGQQMYSLRGDSNALTTARWRGSMPATQETESETDKTRLIAVAGDWRANGNTLKRIDTRKQIEVASYICNMTGEMSKMANEAHLNMLAYFLDMAKAEAKDASNRL